MLGFLMAAAMAGDAPYAAFPNWQVYRDNGSCSTVTGKNTETGILGMILVYDARLRKVKVYFNDPSAKSLAEGDVRKLSLVLANGERVDTGWGEKDYAYTIDRQGLGAFFTYLDDGILADMSASTAVGFYYGKVLLQVFLLDGSSRAIAKLRECAADESAKHPSDPFK